ncbi:MAG: hypothetical protein ACXVBJ_05645 [Flavisolibacter sp.]
MKQIKILIVLIAGMAVISSCRKSDNPKLPELTRFPTPLVQKVTGSDQVISAQDPTTFTGKFTVGLYFQNDAPPQKFDVVVIKNNNKANVKTLQANVTSFPTTITVTGAQLQTLFGAPIVVGDRFDIGVDVTAQNGQQYQAFPSTGTAYASGVSAQPGASTSVNYQAVCKYDPNIYQGAFTVVTDEWADYSAGDQLTLTKIDDTHFSFKYLANNAKPIIVTVNTNTNVVSVAKQVYGDYGPPFGDFSAQSTSSADNFVAPCQGTFSVVLHHTSANGSDFGNYKLVVRKS